MARAKTLLLLGGARYALPVIEAAHALGVRVVTCDYLPDNYAHRFSDGYINASIVDHEAVLRAAKSVSADGIMSFAADPGVTSAAYAAERLGLPFQGAYEAVLTLQDKNRFRGFLRENGFRCPWSIAVSSTKEARLIAGEVGYPVIVKPADSAGSKGCSRVDTPEGLASAVETALSYTQGGGAIVEQFLEKVGESSDADSFAVNGKLECVSFTSQVFDSSVPNPYTPAAYVMPALMPGWAQDELRSELQRVCDLLELSDGVFNIETRVATDGHPYIMEMTPRGGGNRLSEMLRYASGVDLVRASVQAALGMEPEMVHMPEYSGAWYQEMLHSDHAGIFRSVEYVPGFREAHVVDEQLWVSSGERVEAFTAANHAFGSIMMRFADLAELQAFRARKEEFMNLVID